MPALSVDLVVDTDDVTAPVRAELEHLVAALDFARLRASQARNAGSADHLNYKLTILDGGDESTATFTTPISDPALQRLVTRVEQSGQNRDKQ